jgi:hypothetical protein
MDPLLWHPENEGVWHFFRYAQCRRDHLSPLMLNCIMAWGFVNSLNAGNLMLECKVGLHAFLLRTTRHMPCNMTQMKCFQQAAARSWEELTFLDVVYENHGTPHMHT